MTLPLSCRFCHADLHVSFCDLGLSPLSNSYVAASSLHQAVSFYPLHAYVCTECLLVQLSEFESPQHIFSDYAYFSSYSDSWLEHARRYCDSMMDRFSINDEKQVVEIASNDGYLLQFFKEKNIPVLGIEPATNVAEVAKQRGIDTLTLFFGTATAQDLIGQNFKADLLIANNVLAHVPNLNDFVAGMKSILKSSGVITVEFPHLLQLMSENQFDTIYHEHFSYFSLSTVEKIFSHHKLLVFDVEQLTTHGGSLRLYVCHENDSDQPVSPEVSRVKSLEKTFGLDQLETYTRFAEQVRETKRKLLFFLINAKRQGKKIAAYGAPAKGNTLLNYCGIRQDFIDFTVDRSPHKHGKYLPGTHIPVYPVNHLSMTKPDYILILPWNLEEEIVAQLAFTKEWGCQLVVPIPETRVLS